MANNPDVLNPNAIFVDDGGPDAYEFSSNYIGFDALDATDYHRAWAEATRLWEARKARFSQIAPAIRLRRPELHWVPTACIGM